MRFPRPMFAVRVLPVDLFPGQWEEGLWQFGESDADTPEAVHREMCDEERRRWQGVAWARPASQLRALAVYLLYTCDQGKPTFVDIGNALGVGRERARQLAWRGWQVAQRTLPTGYLRTLAARHAWTP